MQKVIVQKGLTSWPGTFQWGEKPWDYSQKYIHTRVCVCVSAPIICYFESTCHLFFTLTICLHMVIADNSEKRNNQKDLTKHNSFPVFKPAAKYEKLSCYSKTCKGAFSESCIFQFLIAAKINWMEDLAILQMHKSSMDVCFLSAGQGNFGRWPLLSPFHEWFLGYNKICQSSREVLSCTADSLKIIYPRFSYRHESPTEKCAKADYDKPTLAK